MPKTISGLEILYGLGYDPVDIESDADYIRALKESFNRLQIQNPSDPRLEPLADAVKGYRQAKSKKEAAKSGGKSRAAKRRKGESYDVVKARIDAKEAAKKFISPKSSLNISKISPTKGGGGGDLLVIKEKVVSIEALLGEQYRLQEENAKDEKKEAEKKRRSLKERLLEGSGKIWDGVKKATSTVLKPFQGIWENIIGFIKKIILGRVLFKILEWTSNKENQGKIDSIFKFLKDWWPVLLTAYLAFGNGLSRFVLGLTGKLVIWSGKLLAKVIPALFKAIAAMGPWGWAALGTAAVVGGGMYLHNKNKNKEGGEETEETGIPDVIPRDEDYVHYGPESGVGAGFSQKEENQKMNKMMEGKNFNKGGQVPGSGNRDTVPAMLTPGEFVMSKGAVQQYGVDTLAGMNAAAGGTNIPIIMSGNIGYSGGGLVQPVVEAGSINSYEDAIKAGVKVEDAVVGNMRYGSMKWTEKLPKGLFRKQKYQIRGTEWMLDGIGKDHNKMLDIPTEDFVNKRMGWDKASSSSTKGNKIKAVPSKSGDPKVDQGGGVGFFKGMGNIIGGKKWSGESRAQIGRSVSKSSNITPPTNTAKVTVINQPGTEQVDASQAQLPPAGNREIPSFDATVIRSSHKMEVLGISV